jgi:hypothetical protein
MRDFFRHRYGGRKDDGMVEHGRLRRGSTFSISDQSIGITLRNLNRTVGCFTEELPNAAAAGHGEQPQLAVARLVAQEVQHGLRICAS